MKKVEKITKICQNYLGGNNMEKKNSKAQDNYTEILIRTSELVLILFYKKT